MAIVDRIRIRLGFQPEKTLTSLILEKQFSFLAIKQFNSNPRASPSVGHSLYVLIKNILSFFKKPYNDLVIYLPY